MRGGRFADLCQDLRYTPPLFQQVWVGFGLTGIFAQVHKVVCIRINTGEKMERYVCPPAGAGPMHYGPSLQWNHLNPNPKPNPELNPSEKEAELDIQVWTIFRIQPLVDKTETQWHAALMLQKDTCACIYAYGYKTAHLE